MNVIEIYEKECSFLKTRYGEHYVYPNIPEGKLLLTRSLFKINIDEIILFTSCVNLLNLFTAGVAITDIGIYHKGINNIEPLSIRWEDIEDIRYHESCLYFVGKQREEYAVPVVLFLKDHDNQQSRIQLVSAFKKIVESVKPAETPLDTAWSAYNDYIKQKQYQKAIDFCLKCIDKDSFADYYFYYLISYTYYTYLQDWNKCIEYSKKGIAKTSNDNTKVDLQYILYSAYDQLGLNKQARKECLSVMLNATYQKHINEDFLIKDAATDFIKLENTYRDEFLTIPYNERKVVMPVRQYVDLHQECIAVIDIQNSPAIKFPMGHPVANQLYVGHPLLPSKYIPFENYQLELVEDRVREFCMLAQSLGATEISVECLNATSTDQNNRSQQNLNAEASTWVTDAKGSVHKDNSKHMMEELSRSVSLHQTFVPHSKPFIPKGMVWYDNEPSWQRLVSQRLNGGMTSHEERIETKKSQMVEGRELLDIKAEVETLFADCIGFISCFNSCRTRILERTERDSC